MTMMTTGFPNCCGAHILHYNLGSATVTAINDKIEYSRKSNIGMLFAITNNSQRDGAKRLKKCGFKKLVVFYNPMHGNNRLVLWGYHYGKPNIVKRFLRMIFPWSWF